MRSALAAFLLTSSLSAQPAIDAYISTGDNHWLGSSLPIDSPQSMADTMAFLQQVNGVQRVYWRGLEEATWVKTMIERPENVRYYSFWQWIRRLYRDIDPDVLAVKEAHARGMEIWGVGTLFDWGAGADTPGFGDYPANAESKLRLEHPEWVPVDKHGFRRQGGPIELAYPEARAALVKLHVDEVLRAGYDGMTFLTYVENYSMRFQDEFGYSRPIVEEFKKRYKLDITKQPFTRYASKEDWQRLRGEYVTAYLRDLKAELAKHHKQLGIFISAHDIHRPQPWNVPELMRTAGAMHFDLETWSRDGIIDLFMVNGNSSPQLQDAAIRETQWLARDTSAAVTFLTSSPHAEKWQPLQASGLRTIIALNEDDHFVKRSAIAEQGVEALTSNDLAKTCKALSQIIEGKLKADIGQLTPLATTGNLVQRRLALQALAALNQPATVPIIEAALLDPEHGIRCMAAQCLRTVNGDTTAKALLAAVEKYPSHPLRETVAATLIKLKPLPRDLLRETATNSASEDARIACYRALATLTDPADFPTFTAAFIKGDRYPRYLATEGMGNIRHQPEVVKKLIELLGHYDVAIANRSAASLAHMARTKNPALEPMRDTVISALKKRFLAFDEHYQAPDADWGWRVVGNALRDFGITESAVLSNSGSSHAPAPSGSPNTPPSSKEMLQRHVFAVWRLPQQPASFSEISEAENDANFNETQALVSAETEAPKPPHATLVVDPAQGPFKTIASAIKAAQPGDTIKLTSQVYKESIVFHDKSGEQGRPIVLDAQGATLDGSDEQDLSTWENLGNDHYRKVKLLPVMDNAILSRWFMLFDGQMQRMSRCSKGPSQPLKKPEELGYNEWTYVAAENALHIRVKPGTRVAAPVRSSGVVIDGNCRHLVIRNTVSTHVYNDGYNIHGYCRDVKFENIKAIECGDDGISAHDECEYTCDGLEVARCATGITDTVNSSTHYRHVNIRDCDGYDLFFITSNAHSVIDAEIHSKAARAVAIEGGRYGLGRCTVRLENVKLIREGAVQEIRVTPGSKLTLQNVTSTGLNFMVTGGAVEAYDCHFSGNDVLLWSAATWSADRNVYQFKTWRRGQTSYTPQTFDAWCKDMNTDAASVWQ